MLKKTFKSLLTGVILCALCLLLYIANNMPVFIKYGSSFTTYENKSSGSQTETASLLKYCFAVRSGESTVISGDFDFNEVLKDFSATVVFIEETEGGKSYYAYSGRIKNYETVNGRKVNLHIYVKGDYTVLGCPIIYGSY